jgi:MerR family transcriptional regulator, light-induced transcriptional regulator
MPQFRFESSPIQPEELQASPRYAATRWLRATGGPRLVGGTSFENKPALDHAHIQTLAQASLKSLEAARQVIIGWQRSGHSLETIYIKGISCCSSLLGQWWCSDDIDFATNTIAHSNLQRLLHDFSSEFIQESGGKPNGLSLLLLAEPGSQHSLGMVMLSQFFKRAGWGVTVGMPQDTGEFKRLFQSDWFDAVGISISTDRHLETLERLLPQLKSRSLNLDLHIFAGGPLVLREPQRLKWRFAEVLPEDAPGTVRRVSASLATRAV